jgi:hypothetical protein
VSGAKPSWGEWLATLPNKDPQGPDATALVADFVRDALA